jgi:outer membrane immunogenic protein
MGRKFWGSLGLLASVLAGAGVAGAADLAVKAPVYKAPPPVILSDWSGFYIGVHGGYGWGHTSIDAPVALDFLDLFDATVGSLDASPKGGVFGGHAGYNWQYGAVVTGLEIDFSGADINTSGVVGTFPLLERCIEACPLGTISRSVKFDELASARARLGYLVLPNLLAYGTAGLGWGHSEITGTISVPNDSVSASADANNFGWVAGGGLEYKLWEHVLVRGEYLHYDFAKTTYSFPLVGGVNATSTVDVVRGGLSYKF